MDRAVQAHLGGTVQYKPRVGPPVTVPGLFEAAFVLVDAGQAGVASSGPAVFLRAEDLPAGWEKDGATITANGVSYRVREARPDGQGAVVLLLHERV